MSLQKDLNDYAESKGLEVKILIGDHYFDNRGISKDSWEIWIFFNETEKTLYGNSFSELFEKSSTTIFQRLGSAQFSFVDVLTKPRKLLPCRWFAM